MKKKTELKMFNENNSNRSSLEQINRIKRPSKFDLNEKIKKKKDDRRNNFPLYNSIPMNINVENRTKSSSKRNHTSNSGRKCISNGNNLPEGVSINNVRCIF